MFKIVTRRQLNKDVVLMEIEAPRIAKKAKAGQFIIFRVDEFSERIPLTVAGTDPEKGTVTIVFQTAGEGTYLLSMKQQGEFIMDFVGPLGRPSELEGYKHACVIGGGVGNAIAWPSAKALFKQGTETDIIAGFRNKDMVVLEEEMRACCHHFYLTTDDGSYGEQGFVTDKLRSLITNEGKKYDLVIAIGPVPMMKFVSMVTKEFGIKTLVSLNPIMIDGTGMCGCCRVEVDHKVKFACVDGPEFDGHEVDYDGLIARNRFYQRMEKERNQACRLSKEAQALVDQQQKLKQEMQKAE